MANLRQESKWIPIWNDVFAPGPIWAADAPLLRRENCDYNFVKPAANSFSGSNRTLWIP